MPSQTKHRLDRLERLKSSQRGCDIPRISVEETYQWIASVLAEAGDGPLEVTAEQLEITDDDDITERWIKETLQDDLKRGTYVKLRQTR